LVREKNRSCTRFQPSPFAVLFSLKRAHFSLTPPSLSSATSFRSIYCISLRFSRSKAPACPFLPDPRHLYPPKLPWSDFFLPPAPRTTDVESPKAPFSFIDFPSLFCCAPAPSHNLELLQLLWKDGRVYEAVLFSSQVPGPLKLPPFPLWLGSRLLFLTPEHLSGGRGPFSPFPAFTFSSPYRRCPPIELKGTPLLSPHVPGVVSRSKILGRGAMPCGQFTTISSSFPVVGPIRVRSPQSVVGISDFPLRMFRVFSFALLTRNCHSHSEDSTICLGHFPRVEPPQASTICFDPPLRTSPYPRI